MGVDDAIKMLSGKATVGEAWKAIFPTLTAATKIAIKVNFNYNQTMPPHPYVVRGITEGLKLMNVGGSPFPAGNIYLYESQGSGTFNGAGYTTTVFPSPLNRIAQDPLSVHGDGASGNKAYANTLFNCNYLINVPGIRAHETNYGGMTMGFKSHFGTYSPNHSGSYPEYHRDINCTGPVYNKTVLTVFGGIFAANVEPRVPSHPYLVKAIVDGLKLMDFGGTPFPAANIYIYDKHDYWLTCGYTAAEFPNVHITFQDHWSNPQGQNVHGDGALNNRGYSDSLFTCDYLINVPVLKGHGSEYGSVTLGFKNHYGTYLDPSDLHTNTHQNVRDINCTGPVYNKTVLTILSAIFGIEYGNSGTPSAWGRYVGTIDAAAGTTSPSTIVMSTDPVTAEFQSIKIKRVQGNSAYTTASMPDYLKASAGVTSITPLYNIGTLAEASQTVGKIINGVVTVPIPTSVEKSALALTDSGVTISPNPANPHAFIEITVPETYAGQTAEISIYSAKGRLARRMSQTILGSKTSAVWDGKDTADRAVSSGTYVVKVQIAGKTLVNKFSLVR
jgi:uncharacterized protein (DUF362 family)